MRAMSSIRRQAFLFVCSFSDVYRPYVSVLWTTDRQFVACGTIMVKFFMIPEVSIRDFSPCGPGWHSSHFDGIGSEISVTIDFRPNSISKITMLSPLISIHTSLLVSLTDFLR